MLTRAQKAGVVCSMRLKTSSRRYEQIKNRADGGLVLTVMITCLLSACCRDYCCLIPCLQRAHSPLYVS